VGSVDYPWDADLVDMVAFKSANHGYKYILIAIDILSQYLWTRPLKNKQGSEVVGAFKDILAVGKRIPRKVRTDKGQEFKAKVLQRYFKENAVHHFVTQNEVKANYAERVIKTLKSRIMRYFTLKQTHKWIDVLASFTDSYNSTYHRSIGMKPQSVNKDNEVEVWMKLYRPPTVEEKIKSIKKEGRKKKKWRNKSMFKFKVGDHVRISNLCRLFEKEYDERWTGEVFKISKRFHRQMFPLYELEDIEGKAIVGNFYQMELQKVVYDDNQPFKIEKVLKTRKRKGQAKESLVRWLHWPKKYDSWIPSSEVKGI
jgi:ribosomal protein L19